MNKITEKTIGVSVAHFNIPANLGKLKKFASIHLTLIEDCAIALEQNTRVHVGNHGDAGCFSFHPVKQLTTGEVVWL